MKKLCALACLILLTNSHAYSQTLKPPRISGISPIHPIIISNDTMVCPGTPVKISTVAGALDYLWTPATYLDDPSLPVPTSTPNDSITYYVDALVPQSNVIVNGDFSDGNTGFTSAYSYANPNVTEGQYYVGKSPQAWNSSLSNCGDHTTGNGNIMLVNGSPAPDVEVWKEVITVTPNTNYAFSTWIEALWPPNPAILSFSINGTEVGNLITAELPTCTWSQFYATWNSGSNTSATISIVNKNTAVQGNDFALDDISFAPYKTIRDSVTIRVEKPLVNADNDTAICPGTALQLHANGADTYTWAPTAGLSSASTNNPVAAPTVTTRYIVTGRSVRGCIAKDTVNVTLYPKPSIQISNDTQVCIYSRVQLLASGGVAYKWFPAFGLSDPAIPNPVASVSGNATYLVTVTDLNTCTNADSVSLSTRPYPNFSASHDVVTCQGTSVNLLASGGDRYLWTPAQFLSAPDSANTSATPLSTTSYSVWIDDSVCHFDSTISVQVTVNPVPVMTVQKSNDINCNMPSAVLTATGAKSYLWSPDFGLDHHDQPTVVASIDKTTKFIVTGANELGCTTTSSVTVEVEKEGTPRFVVPNAFTPNGDGRNDCFGVKHWGSTTLKQFSIYNRWGQVVFQANDPSACWDGTFKGRPQDAGSFEYVIKALTICGIVTQTGTLLLIR